MTRLVTEAELRGVIGYDQDALKQVEQGYRWLRERKVSMPPVFHIEIDPKSAVDVKGAYVEGLDLFALKMASGFYDNPGKGLPSSSSVILVLSAETGFCEAVFVDNGYIMNLRTALAGAVAADHLARREVRTVGVVGTGVQARDQLQALTLVRAFDRVLLWGRDPIKADVCAQDMAKLIKAPVIVCNELAAMVPECDIVVTTTPSMAPLIEADWVSSGTHITAMGSDLPGKQELSVALLQRADGVVCDSIAQCSVGGELQHRPETVATELSDVILGTIPGRVSDADITICDMTGLGMLDTAVSVEAMRRLANG